MTEPIRCDLIQEPLDEEIQVLMDPKPWDIEGGAARESSVIFRFVRKGHMAPGRHAVVTGLATEETRMRRLSQAKLG
jgi:hypothetical protein